MCSKFVAATILASTLSVFAVPAGASAPDCSDSGAAYPELLSIERTSPDSTANGHQVSASVTTSGGVSPVQVYVNFVAESDPFREWGNVIQTHGTAVLPGAVTATSGESLGGTYGIYEVRSVVLVDAADCLTTYHLPGEIVFQNAHIDPLPIHSLPLSELSLEHVPSHQLPPDPADWTASQKYMNALARAFLGRDANVDEMTKVSGALETGGRASLTQELAKSEEWAGIVVDDIYQAALDRDPEAQGRAYWVQRLYNAGKTRDIAVSVYGSNEAVLAAGGDAGAFVDSLYARILGRSPEPSGRAFWVGEFESGRMQPWQLVSYFWESIEFRRQRVDTVYRRILGRSADAVGREHWAGRLLVEDDVALAALLANSDEFYNSAVR